MDAVDGPRFIPACAGNRCAPSFQFALCPVHPRVCGEQISMALKNSGLAGSSPRVRGTVDGIRVTQLRNRFIPACAGNSKSERNLRMARTVHPRVCGEQPRCFASCGVFVGSSPRVRGTGATEPFKLPLERFIPACAGNRNVAHRLQRDASVHPRVCGEQTRVSELVRGHYGSSPRVRGTVMTRLLLSLRSRFIPACAGNRELWL